MYSLKDYVKKRDSISDSGLKILSEDEIKSLQGLLLGVFKDILFVSENNGFHILMAGGSALGTVRHQGFIPWDDDLDLIIPRNECVPFVEKFLKAFPDKYIVTSPFEMTEKKTTTIHIIRKDAIFVGLWGDEKIRPNGVAVDIVPIDYAPDNKAVYYIHGILCYLALIILNSKMMYIGRNRKADKLFLLNAKSILFYYCRLFIGFIFSFVSFEKAAILYDRLISLCKKSNYMTIPAGRKHYFGETHPINVFFPGKAAMFEGQVVYLPNKVDVYLERLYGKNYMEIPPKEKQEIHPCVAFIENPTKCCNL